MSKSNSPSFKNKNSRPVFHSILMLMVFSIVTSCSTRKEIVYFQGIEEVDKMPAPTDFEAEIEVNDVLRIDVSSLNEEIVRPFQIDIAARSGGGSNNTSLYGYLVDTQGNINFPVLGEIEVLGKTREEVEQLLTSQLLRYVKDAVVRVRIANFKVTVMGETGSQVIQVPDERLSVLQAVAMSGDISYDGKRDNVLVIRMHEGKIIQGRVDLTSADIFNSPFFYLKQNDIVYVEPTYRKVKSAGFITSWQGLVSIITTAFSLFVLFNNI